jgi:hypothetical protein
MACGESGQIWNGRVQFEGTEAGDIGGQVYVSLTDAKSGILNGRDNLKIKRIEVHGFCTMQMLFDYIFVPKVLLKKPDHYYAMVMAADEKWWSFGFHHSLDSSVLSIVHISDYNGHEDDGSPRLHSFIGPNPAGHAVHRSERNRDSCDRNVGDNRNDTLHDHYYSVYSWPVASWLVKSDDSNSNINQLFKWLDQKSRVEHKFEVSENFGREIFNKVARIKTWDRLQGIVRSPWKQKGGNDWLGTIRYINRFGKDYDDDCIAVLRNEVDPERSCMITRVMVYKIPLSEKYWTNLALFHSYVVFQTLDTISGETLWWSFEKNTQCIILQRGLAEDSVRDLLRGEKRCQSWFYWRPQLVGEGNSSDFSLANLIDFVHDNDELNITYHGTTENCQCFARVVFDRLTNKELYYGLLPDAASTFNRWLTGNTNPRPRSE